MEFPVNPQGFVTHWLVGGPACGAYVPPANLPKTWSDPLGYEKTLRSVFYAGTEENPPCEILIGRPCPNGEPWRYFSSGADWFVDAGEFYNSPARIRLDAAAILNSDCNRTVSAVIWTYAAVDLWVNGQRVLQARPPVYKPIRREPAELPLRRGENTVYVVLHNLGIRDTRSLFGLQLKNADGISTGLPDAEHAAPFSVLESWLASLTCADGVLSAPSAPPCRAEWAVPQGAPVSILRAGSWKIPEQAVGLSVSGTVNGQVLTRRFELMEHLRGTGRFGEQGDYRKRFLERIAAEKWEPRGGGDYFGVFHVLARRILHRERPDDDRLLQQDLAYIDRCGDCADFLVAGFIRLLHSCDIDAPMRAQIRKTLLAFRYWMDEEGSDGMCFWSENHALMFYGSQMIAGRMYPDDVFLRSGRTGREQSAIGETRCRAWLEDMERRGAEEFNSATYLPVTLAALLNLIDYAPDDLSARASAVADSLMRQLCRHVFQGSVISPQGRVYRDVICPSRQSVQSVLHLISPEFQDSEAENIWCVGFFTSRYRFPKNLVSIVRSEAHGSYLSGNARIVLEKTEDFILTSVRCPRAGKDAPVWRNLCLDSDADRSTNAYVQSLNERFHGTTVFEPGVYGYQQHLWYAAVGCECVVFVNHPGSAADRGEMRPGYWHGNGIFPALRQEGASLGAIYEIPESYPISFTHIFWPKVKFDESVQDGRWLFGRKGNGCIGLWCSVPPQAFDDVLYACEYRCYGAKTAFYCVCGRIGDTDPLAAFSERCKAAGPAYDGSKHVLTAADGYRLEFTPHDNKTQYL